MAPRTWLHGPTILRSCCPEYPEQCPDCICFPESEQPFFATPANQELAAKTKCPVHGDRFRPHFHFYVAKWRLESEKVRWLRLSPQYHKAWHATHPPGSWPETSLETVEDRESFTQEDESFKAISSGNEGQWLEQTDNETRKSSVAETA